MKCIMFFFLFKYIHTNTNKNCIFNKWIAKYLFLIYISYFKIYFLLLTWKTFVSYNINFMNKSSSCILYYIIPFFLKGYYLLILHFHKENPLFLLQNKILIVVDNLKIPNSFKFLIQILWNCTNMGILWEFVQSLDEVFFLHMGL